MINLDTHVVVWLYQGDLQPFSKKALELIEKEDLSVSPAVELELQFLHEIGRLKVPATEIIGDLKSRIGLKVLTETFEEVVRTSLSLDWTRDPMDRLIVGHALLGGYRLLTKDRQIRKHYKQSFW